MGRREPIEGVPDPHLIARRGIASIAAALAIDPERLFGAPAYDIEFDPPPDGPWAKLPEVPEAKDSRHPSFSIAELRLARPHPRAYFCPRHWSWTLLVPYPDPDGDIPSFCLSPDDQGASVGFGNDGAVITQHAFVRLSQKVNPAVIGSIAWDASRSPWADDGTWHGSLAHQHGADTLPKTKWWDLLACASDGRAAVLAPSSSPIPGTLSEVAPGLTKQCFDHPVLGYSRAASVQRAWHTVYMVIANALVDDQRKAIPIDGKTFSSRVPYGPHSAPVWEALGCKVQSHEPNKPLLIIPALDVQKREGRARRAQWSRALLEISYFLLDWVEINSITFDPTQKPLYAIPFKLVGPGKQIYATLGGELKTETIEPFDVTGDPILADAYRQLGVTPQASDDVVFGGYEVQCRTCPEMRMSSFDALCEVAESRLKVRPNVKKLSRLITNARGAGAFGQKDFENAVLVICGEGYRNRDPRDYHDDHIAASFSELAAKQPEEYSNLLQYLRIINGVRNSPMLRDFIDSASSQPRALSRISLDDAYERLGMSSDADDDLAISAYESAVEDRPKNRDIYYEALGTISEHRQSRQIGFFLEHKRRSTDAEMAVVLAASVSPDLPAGLNNIGNTCYLNSLLQFLFSVRQLREVVLAHHEYEQDENVDDKRVGGRLVTSAEIKRSKQFVAHLAHLFSSMIHSKSTAVTPERDLAYLALVSSREDEIPQAAVDASASHPSSDATLVDEPGFIGPLARSVGDVDAANAPSPSSVLGKRKSDSGDDPADMTAMDVDTPPQTRNASDLGRQDTDVLMAEEMASKLGTPSQAQRANTAPPQTSESHTDNAKPRSRSDGDGQVIVDPARSATPAPPALPPRPPKRSLTVADQGSGSAMLFGRQNDVSECMDNCLFQIQAALDDKKLAGAFGEDGNVIKSLFYGITKQSLTFEKADAKMSVKEEEFAYLLVDVAEEGRDLYDALDNVFDESQVDVDGGSARRRVSLLALPPILQIQLQRVQFNRATSSVYKSNAYLKFEDRLHMDRYIEPPATDDDALALWKQTLQHREQMERLRERKTALSTPLPGEKRDTATVLSDIYEQLSDKTTAISHLLGHSFDDDDVALTKEEAEIIQEDAQTVQSELTELKSGLNALWENKVSSSAEYRLVGLFIHRGTATGGHYWALQRNLPDNAQEWLNYNDSTVTKNVTDSAVFTDSTGETANPYWLTYVRVGEESRFDMVRREFEK